MEELQSKIYQVLLGIAYGDSLGMPTENLTPEQIHKYFGKITELSPSLTDGPENGLIQKHLRAGKITDDTANSIFICNMLIDTKGQIDENIFVEYLIDWLDNDPNSLEVTGPSTLAAINNIKHGTKINRAGLRGTTNGAAMRIAPIGLLYSYENLDNLVKKVAAMCVPTHNTRVAIQGAAVVAVTVSYFFRNKNINWNELTILIEHTVQISAKYGNQIPTPDINRRIQYAIHLANTLNDADFQKELYSFLGTGLETIEMVPAVIAMTYKYEGNLKESAIAAANIGGDTDTLAAILGAICGAHNFNIDQPEIDLIEDANDINFKKISVSLANVIEEGTLKNVNK